MRKAFTLIEIVVALGILAVVLSFAGVIFRVSIESHRTALANAEIMQKLRVITEQLDADFKRAIVDYGGRTVAHNDTYTIGGNDIKVHSDCVAFLAHGDFQSTGQYGAGDDETVVGNVAAIFYGQPDPNSYSRTPEPRNRMLLRRQTILAPEAPAADSDPNGEYYSTSLEQWRAGTPSTDLDGWVKRPLIDPEDIRVQLPMYLARGVDNFTISYLEVGDQIGTGVLNWKRRAENEEGEEGGPSAISPRAFKFTFTLYDSRGVIKKGRTFTHIVLVGS